MCKIISYSKICFAGLVILGLLSSCAQKAELIEPAAISTSKYQGWSCARLVKEATFVDDALTKASTTQDKAAKNDTLMVFLIGVPTSRGGIEGEVARLKGEKEALRQKMLEQKC